MTIPIPVPVSQFPDADVPLDGDELVPLVKDGVTSKVQSSAFFSLASRLLPEGEFTAAAGNNHNVPLAGVARLFVDTTAGDAVITGFSGGINGAPLAVVNTGPNLLTLAINTGSDPENQIYSSMDFSFITGGGCLLYYSGTILERWVLMP